MHNLFSRIMDLARQSIQESSSNEGEIENVLEQVVDIFYCKGIPQRLWMTKIVILYNAIGLLVVEGSAIA